MKISELNILLKNPEWNSVLLEYFLSGVKEISDEGIRIEVLYFVLPLLHDDFLLKKLNSLTTKSTLTSFLSSNEVKRSFYGKEKAVLGFKKLTNSSLILLSNKRDIQIGEFVSIETPSSYRKELTEVNRIYAKGAFNLGVILSKEEYINILLRLVEN